ncbi:hypothetical protein Rumeso_02291 [Rubellimicrobium mesophilum DSM 19309]|uniref:Uncharacterized protein n=1 Tax=Rubellimicrobium mesophilum DSM 19309 TaxID=442562 RepID=A0A017HNQ8_9RHOB|nr:hypothetical protein [Rubellimicrobium mesophilum]EYD76102.1 hypothetical protein Rumeso_02291 [Rubellimicrobium mesophilum DSM 19309]
MRRAFLPLLLLAACAEFPALDARIPESERAAVPPPLLPLGDLLAQADSLPAQPAFAPGLAAEAERLQAQAAALPAPATGDDARRLADLRARAEALRDGVLTEEERARLDAGASLP